ncbi:MAG: DUF4340 domain-containing protein [Cyclobacteriaceae bacterium]
MSKLNNNILFVALVVLVGLFVLSRIFRSPSLESNVRRELVKLDSAQVSQVVIQPSAEEGKEVRLVRQGATWDVVMEGRQKQADKGAVQSMLGVVVDLEAQRLVSRKREKWDTFEVGESGTRVSVYIGSDKAADLRIGKLNFSQGQTSGGHTYVRLTDDDEVYTVEGFIGTHFNRKFDEWRNKAVLRINKDEITRLTFNYPDSGFVVQKRDSIWYANDQSVEDGKIAAYLGKLQFRNLNEFVDDFTPVSPARISLIIEGGAGELGKVQAWPLSEEEWIIESSLQKDTYFKSKKSDFVKSILVGPDEFQ